MTSSCLSRRTLIGSLAAGAAYAALTRTSPAAEPEKLDVKDPSAIAVGYVEKAAQVDTKKFPTFVKGSTCENCLQLQGKAGDAYRPCSLFSGKLVSANGWCSEWTPEM